MDDVEREWRADQIRKRHEGLRQAFGDRFNYPLDAKKIDLDIAESKLLREVATTMMFMLETMAQDELQQAVG